MNWHEIRRLALIEQPVRIRDLEARLEQTKAQLAEADARCLVKEAANERLRASLRIHYEALYLEGFVTPQQRDEARHLLEQTRLSLPAHRRRRPRALIASRSLRSEA